ncbi:MAG: hypothetical protein WAV95_15930 [Azonexus sp.]
MKRLLILLLTSLVVTAPAHAQYKCTISGKTVYSDVPCAANAKPVGALEDQVSRQQQLERQAVIRSERGQLGGIEAEGAAEKRDRGRVADALASRDRAESSAKASRCASAQRDLQSAQRAVAVYKDVAWQNSLNQRRAEQDAAERRVRDACN